MHHFQLPQLVLEALYPFLALFLHFTEPYDLPLALLELHVDFVQVLEKLGALVLVNNLKFLGFLQFKLQVLFLVFVPVYLRNQYLDLQLVLSDVFLCLLELVAH